MAPMHGADASVLVHTYLAQYAAQTTFMKVRHSTQCTCRQKNKVC